MASAATFAHAEGKLSVGAGAGWVVNPYKQYDRDVYPLPVINYEGDNFWVRGLGAGYYLWNDTADKLS
ncbi:MipA/OmpV family protein, partial [Cronobacter sakazakii]